MKAPTEGLLKKHFWKHFKKLVNFGFDFLSICGYEIQSNGEGSNDSCKSCSYSFFLTDYSSWMDASTGACFKYK